MTQPIQERTTQRDLGGLAWRTAQLARRPPPSMGGSSGAAQWAYISTQDVGYEHDGSDQWFDFYSVAISDSAFGTIWDYEVDAGAGQFGDDRVFLNVLQSGIYEFTFRLLTSDLSTSVPRDFLWQSRLNVLGGTPGTTAGGTTHRYPGQIGSTPLIQFREQWRISDAGGDDLWIDRSVTVPIIHDSPGNPRRQAELKLLYTPQPGLDEFWTADIWVVRLGDVDWAGNDFLYGNLTWVTGDPDH